MGRAAPGSDSHEDRISQAADALGGKSIQIGRVGRFELGLPLHRQTAQAIHDKEDDF